MRKSYGDTGVSVKPVHKKVPKDRASYLHPQGRESMCLYCHVEEDSSSYLKAAEKLCCITIHYHLAGPLLYHIRPVITDPDFIIRPLNSGDFLLFRTLGEDGVNPEYKCSK